MTSGRESLGYYLRKSLLLCEFMPAGTPINSGRYCKTLENLRYTIQNKRRGMLAKRMCSHQDNARPHVARVTTDLINKFGWDTVTHPRYNSDIVTNDCHLFPEMKKYLGGPHF
ncbi:hypothetical protein Trydic_g17710 [Trypoxylus dichotomus]